MTTGIIGNPIKHSLSPALHSFWMRECKIESTYNIYELEKNNIASFLNNLKDKNIIGLNITIPYKSEVMKYIDVIEQEALDLGAVNTIKVGSDNKLYGYNTDAYGFMCHLNLSAPMWKNKEGHITIIGAIPTMGRADIKFPTGNNPRLRKSFLSIKIAKMNALVQPIKYPANTDLRKVVHCQ